jgi:hypothetical protein
MHCDCVRLSFDFRRISILAPAEPERDERLAVMAAFHDLPFCLDGNLDYLDRAADLPTPG